MADKRISQLIERTDIANNDVLPIVASGATTTNKVTISTIQEWMQDNLDVGVTSVGITIGSTGTDINVTGSPITTSGNITINIPTASATNRGLLSSADWSSFNSKLSSVGLTMPSAFTVSNSPLTANGTIAVTGAGTVAQYIRGDGSLADFPEAGGGGASVSYYLNGSVSQGTIGGIAYYEMNKTPILGAGTDFVAIADGYLASFITDAGDPSLLLIPGGNWNFETYFSASSGGGTPSFYIELYKVDSGGTATLIASNSAVPELIAFGTTITPYFSTLAVPTTVLTLTDRLALRYYVARSGRTITLHTENSHLCQIITTFTTGLTALNGLTAQVQNFATGTSGTDFNISSTSATHTFNLPDASASNRGAVTTGTQTFAGVKTFNSTITAGAEVQLVQAGTALPTFIKNISGSGLTSSGSNGIGFNNSNNLYLSGSDKGGAVFSINNTGVRTYTFQDNNGTLAFTSDIPTNPVGGTGTTNVLAKFTASSTIGDSAVSDNTNEVSISKRLAISTSTSNFILTPHLSGATNRIETTGSLPLSLVTAGSSITLAAGGTTPQITLASTGAVTLTGALNVTNANVNLSNAYYYSGKLVSGTNIALMGMNASDKVSIDPNGYGVVVGNTLSLAGALNGTSATFRNSGVPAIQVIRDLNVTVVGPAGQGIEFGALNGSTPTAGAAIYGSLENPATTGNLVFQTLTAGSLTTKLTLASTGAATFSSSVTAGAGLASGNTLVLSNGTNSRQLQVGYSTGAGYNYLQVYDGSNFQTLAVNNSLFITGTGNVGIGTASPAEKLDVVGGALAAGNGTIKTGITYSSLGLIGTFSNHDLGIISNGTERMRITSGGHVLINRTNISSAALAGSATLQVNNEFISTGTNAGLFWENRSGGVTTSSNWYGWYTTAGTILLYNGSANAASINPSTGAYTALSDENKKKDFEESTIGLNEVLNLKPTLYRMKDDESEGEKELGFIAQEVKEFIPQAYVEGGEEDAKFIGLNYNAIVAALVKSVQELKAEIDSLKTK
jgi:hypothetical protein